MPVNVLGFQTHRDDFAIDFDRAKLQERIAAMRDTEVDDFAFAEKHAIATAPTSTWSLAKARNEVRNDELWQAKFIPVAYRPFDDRWAFYSEAIVDRPRRELIDHVTGKDNLCLGIGRAGKSVNERTWSLQTISHAPMDANIYRRGGVNIFPLWLYPRESGDLLDTAPREKTANLSPEFAAALTQAVGTTPSPEDTLAYIYTILYAPSYRARYADFLKRDFPRVPLTGNRELFERLVNIGRELIALHTMQTTLPRITGFPVAGSNEVVKVRFAASAGSKHGRVWINDAQYFDGVPQAAWDVHIGGYRVAEKWLKDRKGRQLGYDDLTHYQSVIAALARTLELQADIDAAIEAAGGWPLS
ncbi:MAG TPA: type ISP restriction/modification enzyme [Rhodanobacteraceae bacterium]|nr:type ISP restriction/modification enzyme [Rhodanobacteraceae bacterium]